MLNPNTPHIQFVTRCRKRLINLQGLTAYSSGQDILHTHTYGLETLL